MENIENSHLLIFVCEEKNENSHFFDIKDSVYYKKKMANSILIRLSEEEHQYLKEKAKDDERSLNSFIRAAVLRDYKKENIAHSQ